MKELIKFENIKVKVEAKDWKEAIEIVGNLLLVSGKIKEGYIESMIKAVIDMGPYIVITPGLALAHAQPSSDVIENGVSIINLKSPVNFGSANDPVNVVLCLACTDTDSHINVLQSVAEKLMIEGMIERLASCDNEQQIYSLINE
ncbi:PTS sugar transporter subunit IIA [Clostridium omnivorum]|uniref:Ascorbate-specific PTS system EIIA component n=1 Tax=Clostridium omnivorum TaxID=1604902 RepID=A0ABQ5NB15_9CLOT|nr:PTS sugar transporter subunit IIA [Clostridium sp. E14]GLC32457.1 PTS mannitol transporter subunit IIA [Clostridium sp. E14]